MAMTLWALKQTPVGVTPDIKIEGELDDNTRAHPVSEVRLAAVAIQPVVLCRQRPFTGAAVPGLRHVLEHI